MRPFRAKEFLSIALPLAVAATAVAHAGTPADPSPAAVIQVTNCEDDGTGSLRDALWNASEGDTIDLRSLACSRIVNSSSIFILRDNITILGPGRSLLIDGNRQGAVFEHQGHGTLRISSLSLGYGLNRRSGANGGCVRSAGNLRLEDVRVHHCMAEETTGSTGSGGGGIAGHDIEVYDSDISENLALGASVQRYASGGGIFARGHLTLVRSRVTGNTAQAGKGGGVVAAGGLDIRYSEISGNTARYSGAMYADGGDISVAHSLIAGNEAMLGGIVTLGDWSADDIVVTNTTVSGNRAWYSSGLDLATEGSQSVTNSTIASNTEVRGSGCMGALNAVGVLHLESSIVASNRCDGRRFDIGGAAGDSIVGSDNLVRESLLPLPADTISASPRMSPLADNGGLTRTHALWAGSPAIDMGNNNAGLVHDQRGPGFDRVKGGRADIGAHER